MLKKLLDTAILFVYCAVIYWLADQAALPIPERFPNQDKLHHLIAYALMGLLAWRCFSHYLNSTLAVALTSFAFCSIYGLSDEWHQSFVPERYADSLDWLADTLGTGISITALALVRTQRLFF